MPGNFLHIGLIRLILPNARIIHTARHPADTCVSCYSKLFTSGVNYSYDLAELGRYYRGYSELMAHWRTVLPPGAVLDVSYEDVVDDLEGQARRLIDYCGLPWDDGCIASTEPIAGSQPPVPFRSASPCSAPRSSAGAGTKPAWRHCCKNWVTSYPAGMPSRIRRPVARSPPPLFSRPLFSRRSPALNCGHRERLCATEP